MAERPDKSTGNGGNGGNGEFDWIYGKRPRGGDPDATQVRGPAGDEATRMMPTQPPPGRAPSSRPADSDLPSRSQIASEPGQGGGRGGGRGGRTGVPGDPTPKPARSRRRFRVRTVIGLLLLAWIAFLVVTPIITWNKVDKVAWEPGDERPEDQPGQTYLMVGTDSRAGLSKEERQELHTGDADGSRTDTIMVMHTGSGPNLLMSIPRDSQVDVPGHGTTKINAAYAFGGAKLLTQTVENATGLRIDTYVEVGMGGVAGAVDAVGGVEICPKQDMKDPLAGLDIKKGCQEVDGKTALGYARSRHVAATGDLARGEQQREVVAAVGSEVLSPWTFLNPLRYWNLNQAVPDLFTFGEGTSVVRAGLWALAMTDPELTCGVPIADMSVNWDDERSQEMFDYIKEDATDDIPAELCTPTGLPKSVTG